MIGFEEVAGLERNWLESGERKEPNALVDALLQRYPFLAAHNRWNDEAIEALDECIWSRLQEMPLGWRKAIGIEFVEDLRTVLLAIGGQHALETYSIVQIKEKFGGLRWYTNGPEGIDKRQQDCLFYLTETYCEICERICINCGAMRHIRQTGGWIVPICEHEKGYESAHHFELLSYDDEFCVIVSFNPDGSRSRISCKDYVVGADAPIVKELGLKQALHVSDVWKRLCDAELQ